MNNTLKIFLVLFLIPIFSFAEGVFGYWQIDFDGTKKPQTALLVYEYKGLVYGKVVAIYNEKGKITDTPALKINKASGVENTPALCGLDIIWGLKKDGDKYTGGTVLNPDTGNSYSCELWLDAPQLILRGEVLFFGKDKILTKVLTKNLSPSCIIPNPTPNIPKLSFWSF